MKFYHQPALDLFGDVPISHDDIESWVAAIAPRWLTPERSYQNYVKNYAVADKVRRAKIDGTFTAIVNTPRRHYHARLALDAVI